MKRITTLLLFSSFLTLGFSQIHCTPENKQRLQRQIIHQNAQDYDDNSVGEIMIGVGKSFLGTPYVGKTLEINAEEPLVVDLTGLDCTTFLENAVVFTRLIQAGNLTEEAFYQELETLRYRNGERNGYLSRLHYFTDWILENERKGIITQVSEELGGSPWQREINFMTGHADLYPFLEGAEMISELAAVEEEISATQMYYLPKAELASLESGIRNGDLVAITTTVNGLDIAHVGFAIWHEGRVHLFHASSSQKKVVISDKPLADYLAGNRSQSGVMICRLQ